MSVRLLFIFLYFDWNPLVEIRTFLSFSFERLLGGPRFRKKQCVMCAK